MTIDEAKIKIEELACYARTKGWDDEYTEAVNMTIKALEQEPMDIVTDMDCVSRQLVLKQTYNWSKDEFLSVTNPFDYLRKRINSLPSVTPQPCGDYISREETLKTLMDEWTEYDMELIGWLFEKIDKLPSVTPQQKMGHWIYTGDYITDGMLKCSECGFEHDVSERFSYCPNCGAKMSEIPTGAEGSEE